MEFNSNHLSSTADTENMHDLQHPVLYEINTRVWLRQFDTKDQKATLKDVPSEYWQSLREKGVDYVWLMGVWASNEAGIEKNIFTDDTLDFYHSILTDLSDTDIIGSPYAIDTYDLNPLLGTTEELVQLRENLHAYGMKLILDFVPNHFGKSSSLIEENPGLFLMGTEALLMQYPEIFFRSKTSTGQIFAHGKDMYSGAWRDTIQVDYSKQETREFITNELIRLSELCDGVRCDMAMIVIKRLFQQSWGELLPLNEIENWINPIWSESIKKVKNNHPDFQFIAECYWGTEGEMLSYGFDFVYDKGFLDKVKDHNIHEIKNHLSIDPQYLSHGVFFLENHDEDRAASYLEPRKLMAYSILIATSPGMCIYYDGQWIGKRIRIPVQLGREPVEPKCSCPLRSKLSCSEATICSCIESFYDQLLKICAEDIFKKGSWELLDQPNAHIIGFLWKLELQKKWIFINLGAERVQLFFEPDYFGAASVFDELNQMEVSISKKDEQFKFDLYPYQSVILKLKA